MSSNMSSKSIHVAICLLFWMIFVTGNQGAIFDVKKYGATADGRTDDSQAITKAWTEACGSTSPSTLLIPEGTYLVNQIELQGPCKAPIEINALGATLQAPPEIEKFSKNSWVKIQNVAALTISGGTFDGQGSIAWAKNDCAKTGKCNSLPINLSFNKLINSIIRNITSLNSKLFHMNILGANNLTLQYTTIDAPENSLNTDGIHIGRSDGVNITDAHIKTGDDCVSLGDGSQHVHVEKVTCGPGHGISVGSLGKYDGEKPVIGVTVKNCTITNTMNGVRVKTWPASPNGIARDMHFEDIVMNNVSTPILIDQGYCPYGQCKAEVPSRIRIADVSFDGIRGTSATKVAVRLVCSRGIPCENVKLSNINLEYTGNNGSAISECANIKPTLSGQLFPPACSSAPDA